MSTAPQERPCGQAERVALYALEALPASDVQALEAHIGTCPECRRELDALRRTVDSFDRWPIDVLRPSGALWDRLAARIAAESGEPALPAPDRWREAEWEEVAPGIRCKLLANDAGQHRISMLVQLAPGTSYPPHRHGGVEELHLLEGELWIGERKLHPGDYNRASPGTVDTRVWSETGCTCVLIASAHDVLL